VARKRIGLSMRLDDAPEASEAKTAPTKRRERNAPKRQDTAPPGGSMADAFARAKRS
jgi:Transcriptional accessory protein